MRQLIDSLSALVRDLREVSHEVYAESVTVNMERIGYVAFIAAPLSLIQVVLFLLKTLEDPVQLLWRTWIMRSHLSLSLLMLCVILISINLRRRKSSLLAYQLVQYTLIFCVLLIGVAITVIDQMVTPSITPFLISCTVVAMVFLLRPVAALLLYLGAYYVFHFALPVTQANEVLILSNRVNGLTSVGIGVGLSVILWSAFAQSIRQRKRIELQQTELEYQNTLLEYLATRDDLTGLLNRKEFARVVSAESARMRRSGQPAALVLADIDNFKQVNDTHGHPVGDEVLVQFATLLKCSLREVDSVSRWGGEEFIILLPDTSLSSAAKAGERLRLSIEEHLFTANNGEVELRLTSSFGVAELRCTSGDALAQSYEAADRALYRAKGAGRNKVVVQN